MSFCIFQCQRCISLQRQIVEQGQLIAEHKKQIAKFQERFSAINALLNEDQVQSLTQKVTEWSPETITKGLKYRYAVGVHGYKFLRQNGWPIPGYSTLTSRTRHFTLQCGLIKDMFEPLKTKIQEMEPEDRISFLSMDSMEIHKQEVYDKTSKTILGYVTLNQATNDKRELGSKLLIAVIRGVKYRWKQVIGCHVVGTALPVTEFSAFVKECISFCQEAGMYVIAYGSDMGPENQGLFRHIGVEIPKNGVRRNYFQYNDSNIYIMPDVCHTIKNLKNCLFKSCIILPKEYATSQGFTTNVVSGEPIRELWNIELKNNEELRSLHHIKEEHLWPDNFQSMNVGYALRIFDIRTSAAIRTAVHNGRLHQDALFLAHFIDLFTTWFNLLNSKIKKKSITSRNCEKKYDFLEKIISLVEGTQFGKTWLPLNKSIIMSSLSFIDICEQLFQFQYTFVLGHRFTQDGTENIFSCIRRKAGMTPNVLQCLTALKGISVSQFLSDVQRSNYCTDSDTFLVDFFRRDRPTSVRSENLRRELINFRSHIPEKKFTTYNFEDFKRMYPDMSNSELGNLYYLCGSTQCAVLKKVCLNCTTTVKEEAVNLDSISPTIRKFMLNMNMGALQDPCLKVLNLIINCEILYRKFKSFIRHNSSLDLINKINNDIDVQFRKCTNNCDIKLKIINHYFTVRGYSLQLFSIVLCKRNKKQGVGTASAKRKKMS